MYHHLEPSEIRLLQIQGPPSERDDQADIACELIPVALDSDDVPPYTALSYVWGSNILTQSIIVGGQRKRVTQNLFLILKALSTASSVGRLGTLLPPPAQQYFWIDGLCINQDDKLEKEVQVDMMGQIYRKASLTLMWIHDSSEENLQALEWFTTVAELDEGLFEDYVNAGQLDQLFDEYAWNALCDFLVQSFFRRRWIIQEIALSPDPWLVCGERAIDWRTIEIGYDRVCCKIFNEISLSRTIKTTDIETIAAAFMLRWRIKNKVNTTLLEVLVRLRRCDTTEARDRIYALRALCSNDEASHLPVAYRESTAIGDIFAQQVVAHIRTQGNLDILCICREDVRIERLSSAYTDSSGLSVTPDPPGWARSIYLPDLPTWVPNWTSPFTYWHLSSDSKAADAEWKTLYSASGDIRPILPDLDQAVQTKLLTVTGIQVDTVQYIERFTPPPHPDQRNPASKFFIYCFILHQMKPLHETPFQSEADRLDSFWRTLTLGGRKAGTHDFFTMEFIRYRCLEYFQSSRPPSTFGSELARRGFHRPTTRPPQTRWFTREGVPAVYFEPNQHNINFDHLTAFRFFVTESGRMGLGPPRTQPGDRVCILFGCSSPMLLCEYDGKYQIRGEAYVDGYMQGEAIQMMRAGEFHERTFPIV